MIRKLFPLFLFAGLVAVAVLIMIKRPEVHRNAAPPPSRVRVETLTLEPRPYRIRLQSYGTVRPRTRSVLLPQVSGQITALGPNFRDGGFFEKGEVLLQIDSRDYEAAVANARSTLAQARQALIEEQAQAKQALQDWRRLGNRETPPPLVSRKPQLAAAKAAVQSAEASLRQAQLDLSRTRIRAPYAGRVLSKDVDVGQVVNGGTTLGEIYATDYVEIRLPLKNSDLNFIDLPETYRFGAHTDTALPAVTLRSTLSGSEVWHGRVVRTEGAIDPDSQQLHVVATVDDPYGRKARGRQPLKINQYVKAWIDGRTLKAALVIPNKTLYQGSYVYLVKDGVLKRQDVEILWQNSDDALIGKGLAAGDRLVTTPLGQVNSGTRVEVLDKDATARRGNSGPPRGAGS